MSPPTISRTAAANQADPSIALPTPTLVAADVPVQLPRRRPPGKASPHLHGDVKGTAGVGTDAMRVLFVVVVAALAQLEPALAVTAPPFAVPGAVGADVAGVVEVVGLHGHFILGGRCV